MKKVWSGALVERGMEVVFRQVRDSCSHTKSGSESGALQVKVQRDPAVFCHAGEAF